MRPEAQRFLANVQHDCIDAALALLREVPDLPRAHIAVAAAIGDVDAVAAHLAHDTDTATSTVETDGVPPLIFAVQQPIKDALGVSDTARRGVVEQLLDAGADPNAWVPFGDPVSRIPALYFVAIAGQAPLVRLLLERGARPTDGESVYHAAQHDHRDCLATLLEFGAELSGAHDTHGNTPLHFLASHRASNPVAVTALRGMAWLLAHGADPSIASSGPPADVPRPTAGECPLHRIAAGGHDPESAAMLLDHGAPIDAMRADGRTAHALAVRSGNTRMADYLASRGADVALLSSVDELVGACARGDEQAVQALRSRLPDVTSALMPDDGVELLDAIEEDRLASVSLMLSLGWPLTAESEWGGTALHWATWRGHAEVVRQLIGAGAPINVRDSAYGSSPIAWAAHGSQFSGRSTPADYATIVDLLLDAGATRLEATNRWGESLEQFAVPAVRARLAERGFIGGAPGASSE
ncbi:MAG: ankyrin repeat domain-containing protein [Gemmatimonadaceae bacterium]|jgi:ankyrin repeat protein|nr:ankyrin repeat domain-containing protein [Gemmatimonadaceae bacterium]